MWRTLPLLVLTQVASSPHGTLAPGGAITATPVRPRGRWSGPRGGHTPKDDTIAVPAHGVTRPGIAPPTGHGRRLGSITTPTGFLTTVRRNDAATQKIPGDPHTPARADDAVGPAPRVHAHLETGHATGTTSEETTSDGASSFGVPGDGPR